MMILLGDKQNSSILLVFFSFSRMEIPAYNLGECTPWADKSQFADDAGQWAVSKNIDLAAEYLQRDLDKLAR